MPNLMRLGLPFLLCVASSVSSGGPIIPTDAALPVIDWKDAAKYLDREVVVQGKIVATRNIGKLCFLNFDAARTFTAIVRQRNYKGFPQPPERMYRDKLVRIRGIIFQYKGRPEIEVTSPDQIKIIEHAGPISPQHPPKRRPFDGHVTVGTFNVYNLFDEYDDPYHADEGTPAKPKEQLERLADTIRAMDADVLALQEVENRDYLERFVAAFLGDMGYGYVVCVESNDRRGIDCAVLSRLPVGPVTSYRHLRFPDGSGEDMWFRRDLLRAEIEPPGGHPFTVFVVHLKSKRGGAEATEKYRLGETRQVRKILDRLLRRNSEALFIICGDFNDTWKSAPLRALLGEGATRLHDFLADLPEGAATYNREPGGMIDFVITSPAMAKRYTAKSYRIIPGTVASLGSDHNPVLARFDLRSEEPPGKTAPLSPRLPDKGDAKPGPQDEAVGAP